MSILHDDDDGTQTTVKLY